MTSAPQLIWPVEAMLGEGPVWFPEEGALRFVDIKLGHLHRHGGAEPAQHSHDLGGQPSFVVPADDGGLVVGSGHHILHIGKDGVTRACLARLPMPAHNRTNDATVDGQGRLWFGTMDGEEQRPTGALWCWDRGVLHHMGGEAVVTNGPAISHDGTQLYHVDSAARTIWRFTIGEGPSIAHREIFLQFGEADGHPDGIVIDAEGCLWVALWDGWGVRRYDSGGRLLQTISLPCARVTKIAFGGTDLRTAYVTTARVGLGVEALAEQPHAGGLFAFAAPVAGRVLPHVVLNP